MNPSPLLGRKAVNWSTPRRKSIAVAELNVWVYPSAMPVGSSTRDILAAAGGKPSDAAAVRSDLRRGRRGTEVRAELTGKMELAAFGVLRWARRPTAPPDENIAPRRIKRWWFVYNDGSWYILTDAGSPKWKSQNTHLRILISCIRLLFLIISGTSSGL